MRYAATHKQATRERLIDSSRAIAKRQGFGATGVDALMQAVGLSGGAFYGHFGSKAELFAALVQRELAHSGAMLGGGAPDAAPDAAQGRARGSSRGARRAAGPATAGDAVQARARLARSLRRYLSSAHAQQPEAGCALPALGAEIARAEPAVRAGVERSIRQLQHQWAAALDGDADTAWALLSQCVGALVLARAVASERTCQEILAANRRVALAATAGDPR